MQKKIIALAVAGLVSGAAFAQSNVTIYGVADTTFEYASATGAANSSQANRGGFSRLNSNSSLIGFKGSEDLGNGLKAVFQFEQGVSVDAGAATLSNRDTYAGVTGAFGTAVAGFLSGPSRNFGSALDLNAGATGPGANSSIIGKAVGTSGAGAFDTRFANTIAYVSPTMAGVSLQAAYVSGENKSLDSATTQTKINTKGVDLGLTYTNGGIFAGITFGKIKNGLDSQNTGAGVWSLNTTTGATTQAAAAAALDEQQLVRLGGSYTFAAGHKIVALWEQNKNSYVQSGNGTELKRNIWGIGGKFMVSSAGGLIAQYYNAANTSGSYYGNTATGNTDRGAQLWEIGYEHALSKRTMLKASYTQIDNKANASYDFNVGAVGGSFGSGANPQVLAAGLRHTF